MHQLRMSGPRHRVLTHIRNFSSVVHKIPGWSTAFTMEINSLLSAYNNNVTSDKSDHVVMEISNPLDIISDIPSTPSASPLIQIPNFIQAILTLIISGLLLAASLILIRKCKQCCTKRKSYYDEENQAEQIVVSEIEAAPQVPTPEDPASRSPVTRQATSMSAYSSRSSSRNSQRSVKVPRRPSGPFGDEALEHAAETYKKVNKEYEDKVSSWSRRVSTRRGNLPTVAHANTGREVVLTTKPALNELPEP